MTIIACRNGTIAADRLCSTGNDLIVGCRTKIFAINGALCGTCGITQDAFLFKSWIEGGRNPHDKPVVDEHFLALVLEPDGTVTHYNGKLVGFSIEGSYFAIGTGDQTAMGAMFMGASAEDAVRAASAHVLGCGGGVDALRLPAAVESPTAETPPTATPSHLQAMGS